MKIEIPTECPICGSAVHRVNDQLFCSNSDCEAVTFKKTLYFAKSMKIKGLGEKTLEKLDISDIADIYSFSEETLIEILGDKIGTKLYQEIEDSKNTDFSTLLSSFSIPLIGKETATKLGKVISSFDNINLENCKFAKLGDKATSNLLEWVKSVYPKYKTLPFNLNKKQFTDTTSNIVVCISGKLKSYKTKAEAETWLNDNGITVVDAISKKVTYLIKEDDKTSSKEDKAKQYNIPIITLEKLKEIINNE